MSVTAPHHYTLDTPAYSLLRKSSYILQAALFSTIYKELNEYFMTQQQDYLRIIKSNSEHEKKMIEESLVQYILCDILLSREYTLPGIAYYTHIPYETLEEIITGKRHDLSSAFLIKIIDLHSSIRADVYNGIMDIVTKKYQATK